MTIRTTFLWTAALAAPLGGAALATLPAAAPASWLPQERFEDSFDGLGLGQLDPIDGSKWDVSVHTRAKEFWFQLEPMQAAHGLDTSPPPATHVISAYEDAVYVAREHMMTAINAETYGLIYLTPHALADWSEQECVVRFDVSTLRTSRRDWIDVWITPWNDNMILPLEDDLPDLQGNPRRGLQFRMGTWNTIFEGSQVDWSHFEAIRYDDHQETLLPFSVEGYESRVTPDARQRQTIELRISAARIRLGMPEYGLWWVDTPITGLGYDAGVVQFGHHSYNPMKPGTLAPIAHDTSLAGTADPSPNSWHWDAFSIEPAIPFESIPGDRRFVVGSNIQPVTFAKPAPRDAFLRFAAHSQTEVSFDGGPFVPARRQDGSREALGSHDYRFFSSYWMPIPEGTTHVRVRMTPENLWAQYGFETMAKDFSIWHRPEVRTIPGGPEAQPGPALPTRR
ncbi:MAG: hypothetical protein AAGG01_16805 [Planctomycetota bacterium]